MDYNAVFKAYPDAQKIWVVDNMPFLTETEAVDHARRIQYEGDPEVVDRPAPRARAYGGQEIGKDGHQTRLLVSLSGT